jgi:hypothetical protein
MPLVRIHLSDEQITQLHSRLSTAIDISRQQFVHDVTQAVVDEIANTVPIDTGETQQAWLSESTRVASTAPTTTGSVSSMTASVDVEQMRYLEYGTTRMIARAPIRRALEAIAGVIDSLFRW